MNKGDIQQAASKLIHSDMKIERYRQDITALRTLLRKLKSELYAEMAENRIIENNLNLELALNEAYHAANGKAVK